MANPLKYNGSSIVAMAGKDCVSIASDLNFNVQLQHIGRTFKVYQITDKILLGLSGLQSDCISFYQVVRYQVQLLKLKENRTIQPESFITLVGHLLYSKRWSPYYLDAVIAGLDDEGHTFVSGSDLIGCMSTPNDFVVAGTGSDTLYGVCETFWNEGMDADHLFEATSQALLAGCDRDSYSGWGAVTYILTKDKLITRFLRSRQD